MDSLREDPDVLMVGELRDPETMRLTLNAAETATWFWATVHSFNVRGGDAACCGGFPAEIQNNVSAQLAELFDSDHFPAAANTGAKRELRAGVRGVDPDQCHQEFHSQSRFFKIQSSMETGADVGMWTFQRYRSCWTNGRDISTLISAMPRRTMTMKFLRRIAFAPGAQSDFCSAIPPCGVGVGAERAH